MTNHVPEITLWITISIFKKNNQTNKQSKNILALQKMYTLVKIGKKTNYKTNVLCVFILIYGTLCRRCYSLNRNGRNSCSGHSNHHKSSYHRIFLWSGVSDEPGMWFSKNNYTLYCNYTCLWRRSVWHLEFILIKIDANIGASN